VSVDLAGFEALIEELRNAPKEIRDEAMEIVRDTTEAAATEIRSAYPKVTGNLASRIRTSYPASGILAGIVMSTAPHSHLYEWGTRQRMTASGANRGKMPRPKQDVTPPIAIRHRRRMYERLIDMLRAKGFQIGD
jgi:hypothetical protein